MFEKIRDFFRRLFTRRQKPRQVVSPRADHEYFVKLARTHGTDQSAADVSLEEPRRRHIENGTTLLTGAALGYAISEIANSSSDDSGTSQDYSGDGGQFDGGGASGGWDSDSSNGGSSD